VAHSCAAWLDAAVRRGARGCTASIDTAPCVHVCLCIMRVPLRPTLPCVRVHHACACVCASCMFRAETKQVDALFASLDEDGGGTLDVAELKSALKGLVDAATSAANSADAINARTSTSHP
jgi:hypothetical protein